MKTTKRILALLMCMAMILGMIPMIASAAEETTLATFTFPTSSKTTTWQDGGTLGSNTSFTADGYTLTFTNCTKVYQEGNDAAGRGFIKFGTSSEIGSLTFTVPNDVTRVELQLAGYKAKTSKYSINGGAAVQITKQASTAAGTASPYDVVSIDTSTEKTVTVATVSGAARMVMFSVIFYGSAPTGDCQHTNLNDAIHVDGKHVAQCKDCEEMITSNEYAVSVEFNEAEHYESCTCGYTGTAAAHEMSDWTEKTPATAAAPGVETKTCSGCAYTISREIPQLESTGKHYIKYTNANLLSGSYILIAEGNVLGTYDSSTKWILKTTVPVIDENTVADDLGGVWTLTVTDAGVILTDANGVTVAPKAGDNNGILASAYVWAWAYDEATGTYSFSGVGSDTTKLALNKSEGKFRSYKTSTLTGSYKADYVSTFTLYKLEGEQSCDHETAYTTTETTHIAYCSKCPEVFVEESFHDMKGENGACSVCSYEVDKDVLAAAIVEAAFALESGASMSGIHTLTGTITVINDAYDATYKNITVTILVGDKEIQCYRMTGTGCDKLVVGDVITVDGAIKNYNGTVEFDKPAMISYIHTHVYDDACDADCNTCGETREASHQYAYPCDADCNICGATREASHQYANPCDAHCMICYELTNPDAAHTIAAVEAKAATCTENGNIAYWYCEHCGAVWADEALTQITNRMSVVIPAPGHTYDDNCDADCNVCEEFREAPHNLTTYVEAVVPANCKETGHNEYWICEDCGGYFMSNGMGGYYETNPDWINYPGDHVRPEGTPGCAVVACELCGEDSYGTEACVRDDTPVCQNGTCVNCGEIVLGEGHSYGYDEDGNSLIPLCQAGDCIHCGEHLDYIYECENGSYAPCSVDGECVYGCGKQFPATGEHAIDDPCVGGLCWMCWEEIAPAHEYVDGKCSVCGEADPNAPTGPIADANLTFLGAAGISFQDYIGMNIMFYNGTAANYDKFYAIATQVDPDGNAVETLCNVVPYSYAGYDYTIFEHQVMAWSMTEQVTLTLYAEKDGVVYVGQSITTSVQALALEKLATYAAANNTVNCAALVDMLNYGAAVQVNQKHFVESLPSAGDYASYGTATTPEFNATTSVTGSGIIGNGPSISMQAKVEFNIMYSEADLAGKTVKAFVDGEEVEVLYNYDAAPGWPIARVVIKANQMRSTFTIAVYDADGNVVSEVIETSIEACAQTHLGGANNDLVIALMNYGDSVSKVG